jgi:hypothetical protein
MRTRVESLPRLWRAGLALVAVFVGILALSATQPAQQVNPHLL